MSSIAPVDVSHQVEAGLPVSTEAHDEEPVKPVAPVPKTGGSRRYVILTVIAVSIGVGTILGLSLGLTQGGSSSGASTNEVNSAGFPAVYAGCIKADPVVVDGSTTYGQPSSSLSEDVPVCGQDRVHSSGNWYTVTAEEDGTLMALFFGFHQFAGVSDFVSVFEGDCSGELTCFDGTYHFDGLYGYYTWNAVAGVEYKMIAHAGCAFGLRVVTL
jgi:hypothetical protein